MYACFIVLFYFLSRFANTLGPADSQFDLGLNTNKEAVINTNDSFTVP